MKQYKNVCEVIVPNDYCAGCGICAGVCPTKHLNMGFNTYGEYRPTPGANKCLEKCALCLSSCPFWNQEDNEDSLANKEFGFTEGMKYTIETGYYLENFVGYSKVANHRINGSSGGIATWTLENLLRLQLVDYVICVTSNSDKSKLFKFAVFNNVDDIRKSSKSCYYPVEVSEVVRNIQKTPGRYAIIGLPCVMKGLRLAMRSNKLLRERVVFLLGLVCGQSQSKLFSEFICCKGGGDPSSLSKMQFRVKQAGNSVANHGIFFEYSKGGNKKNGTIFWNQGIDEIWSAGYFKQNACDYCDDIFAELADITFMDAWLPKYMSDSLGVNIIVVRSVQLLSIINNAIENGELSLNHIAVQDVIKSQMGLVRKKRYYLSYRLDRIISSKGKSVYYPIKRVIPMKDKNFIRKNLMEYIENVRSHVLNIFAKDRTVTGFRKTEKETFFERKIFHLITLVSSLPVRILNKTKKNLTKIEKYMGIFSL